MTLKISRNQVSTQPNPTHQKLKKNFDPTQPMDGPNPWPTLGPGPEKFCLEPLPIVGLHPFMRADLPLPRCGFAPSQPNTDTVRGVRMRRAA